jgi:general secretion pathway protein D
MISKNLIFFALFFTLNNFNESNAQFRKYRAQKDFSQSNQKNTPSAKDLEQNNPNKIFGRSTGISNTKSNDKNKKFVNLNPETAFGPEVVSSFDFPNVDLLDLTKHMQKLTGINLILDKDVRGKVSILAPSPITVGDAWKAYLTALNLNNYTLVKSGAFYKIVASRDARYTPTKIYRGNYTPDTENYVMRIIPLKHIQANEISRSFRPFMSRFGRIIDIKQTNTVIIHDTGQIINNMVQLIKFLDVTGHEESLHIIKVKFSSAQEIAKLLGTILNKGKSRSKKQKTKESISKIIAEPRTNSIIAMANLDGAGKLKALIRKLDVKVTSGDGGIHVYYLNYGNAESLSKTLSSLVAGSTSKKSTRFSSRGSQSVSLFSSAVKITADKDNNALVITASPTDYLTIQKVIKKLDIPRDQVYVEGLIMETNIERNKQFGTSILGAYGSGARMAGFTGGSSDLINVLTQNITSLGGLFIGGAAGQSYTYSVAGTDVTVNTVNALISAIATDTNTNVLATPQILALDNTESVFEVGEQIPTPEKTTAANGSTSVSLKNQKVTLELKITPQINKVTRTIKLKINQKVNDFSQRQLPAGIKNEGVAVSTRNAQATVIIRDKDTIAMGGLMRDKEVARETKVPLLGDIPVIGWLFKQTANRIAKVNLLFFLTPRILASYEKTVPETMKDLLNRRNLHLKDEIGSNDPFDSTVKGLYKKALKQEKGPLYDEDDILDVVRNSKLNHYKKQNVKKETEEEELTLEDDLQDKNNTKENKAPNYNEILKKVNKK